MTPEERAFKIAGEYADRYHLEQLIAAAIREAVAEEREACAELADECFFSTGYAMAHDIRARGKTHAETDDLAG